MKRQLMRNRLSAAALPSPRLFRLFSLVFWPCLTLFLALVVSVPAQDAKPKVTKETFSITD
jgi:hypothetical protein